jgi:hypothetical protein
MDARKSMKGVGAEDPGGWSVAIVKLPKCASMRAPPGNEKVMSMAGALRNEVIPDVSHATTIYDVCITGRAELRGGVRRPCTGAAVHQDATLVRDTSPFEPRGEFIDRNAHGTRQVAHPEFKFRTDVHDQVECFATESRHAFLALRHDTLRERVEIPSRAYSGQKPMAAVNSRAIPTYPQGVRGPA